jgi:hypothetical protein
MTWDITVLLVCLTLQVMHVRSPIPGAVAYLAVNGLLVQLAFFMRTDIYYVVTNWLQLGNLMGDTQRWLLNVLRHGWSKGTQFDAEGVPERERPLIQMYGVLLVIGVAATIAQFVVFGLPLLLHFAMQAMDGLAAGVSQPSFWDSAAFLLLTTAEFSLLGFVMWREHGAAGWRALTRLTGTVFKRVVAAGRWKAETT